MKGSPAFRKYGNCLFGLLALFSLRVAGQFIQVVSPTDTLPPLALWQGSGLPYEVLFGIQILILVLVAVIAYRILRGRLVPRKRLGRVLLSLGAVYFAVMLVRLVLGLTVLGDHAWFAKPIPAFFHLVLAGMVLTIGRYHWREGA